MTLLEIENLTAGDGNGDIIRNISFSLDKGEFLCILGRNGSGKSTLIKAAQGLLKHTSGMVRVEGTDIFAARPRNTARQIAYVPQQVRMSFGFSVEEVILMGRYIHQGRISGVSRRDREFVEEIMALTETTHLRMKSVAHLSGGERQRVLIARALAQDTPLLFLDEPSAHLDISYQVEIYRILEKLQREKDKTILSAEHNINLAAPFAQKILFLKEGSIHSLGPPQELISRENILQVFGADVTIRKNQHSGLPEISLTYQVPERR